MTRRRAVGVSVAAIVVVAWFVFVAGPLPKFPVVLEAAGERLVSPGSVMLSADGRTVTLTKSVGHCNDQARDHYAATAWSDGRHLLVAFKVIHDGWIGIPNSYCNLDAIILTQHVQLAESAIGLELIDAAITAKVGKFVPVQVPR